MRIVPEYVCGGDGSKSGCAGRAAGVNELRRVRQIESFGAELDAPASILAKWKGLNREQSSWACSRTSKDVATGVSDTLGTGSRKRFGVEPALNGSFVRRQRTFAEAVGSCTGADVERVRCRRLREHFSSAAPNPCRSSSKELFRP